MDRVTAHDAVLGPAVPSRSKPGSVTCPISAVASAAVTAYAPPTPAHRHRPGREPMRGAHLERSSALTLFSFWHIASGGPKGRFRFTPIVVTSRCHRPTHRPGYTKPTSARMQSVMVPVSPVTSSVRPGGEQAAGSGVTLDGGGDLLEFQREHIVQQEGRPLAPGETFQRQHQRQGDVRLALLLEDWIGKPRADIGLGRCRSGEALA